MKMIVPSTGTWGLAAQDVVGGTLTVILEAHDVSILSWDQKNDIQLALAVHLDQLLTEAGKK